MRNEQILILLMDVDSSKTACIMAGENSQIPAYITVSESSQLYVGHLSAFKVQRSTGVESITFKNINDRDNGNSANVAHNLFDFKSRFRPCKVTPGIEFTSVCDLVRLRHCIDPLSDTVNKPYQAIPFFSHNDQ